MESGNLYVFMVMTKESLDKALTGSSANVTQTLVKSQILIKTLSIFLKG